MVMGAGCLDLGLELHSSHRDEEGIVGVWCFGVWSSGFKRLRDFPSW